ncbi:MAG: cache domain-containing protein [Pirellulales bacterium]|nr:cache domain-containing protein [Pirellulales bacterium]
MRRQISLVVLFALAGALGTSLTLQAADRADSAAPQGALMESPAVRDVVELVRKAAELVRAEGEDAFGQFQVQGGPWYHGTTYIFVNDLEGDVLVDPNRPELQGTNQIGLEDQEGRPIVQMMLEEVAGPEKEGWVHYLWPKFALSEPYWKSSFVIGVTAPSGKQYVVGSGLYDAGPQGVFVIDTVNEAVTLLEKEGRAAFNTFREPNGPFRYYNTFVYVFDDKGVELVDGAFPAFEEQNLLDYRDPDGQYPVREMIEGMKTASQGWHKFKALAPDSAQVETKLDFVRKVQLDGETLYVGSGLYLPKQE